MKHYHVHFGLQGGYLPNDSSFFEDRQDARNDVALTLEGFRDEGTRVATVVRGHQWTVGEHEYIELLECDDEACWEHRDE